MKEDNSKRNFNYSGLDISEIIDNPDEYIVPECLDACKAFWDRNIFTASCSNRNETKTKSGIVLKYVMVGTLSDENMKIFSQLAKSDPNHYRELIRCGKQYYAIVIPSTDNEQDRDSDSKELLSLTSPFKMQDCLEGFVSIEDYYLENLTDNSYPRKDKTIPISDDELIKTIKFNLSAFGKLDLLDLDRRVIYNNMFYKKAHEKYLAYLKSQPTNPDPHDDR